MPSVHWIVADTLLFVTDGNKRLQHDHVSDADSTESRDCAGILSCHRFPSAVPGHCRQIRKPLPLCIDFLYSHSNEILNEIVGKGWLLKSDSG